jgi:hypothetical protein
MFKSGNYSNLKKLIFKIVQIQKMFKSKNCSNLKKFKFQKTQKKLDKYNLKPFKTAKPKSEKNRTKLDSTAFLGRGSNRSARGGDAFQRARGR